MNKILKKGNYHIWLYFREENDENNKFSFKIVYNKNIIIDFNKDSTKRRNIEIQKNNIIINNNVSNNITVHHKKNSEEKKDDNKDEDASTNKKIEKNDYWKNKKEYDNKLNQLKNIAENKLNCTLGQLAIAWVIANPDVSCCLIGATKGSQIEENAKAIEIYKKLDKDLFIEIEKILDNVPEGEIDYRDWRELPSRRNIAMGIDFIKSNQ